MSIQNLIEKLKIPIHELVIYADYPVSCITIYNSIPEAIKTFYLGDYESREIVQSFHIFLHPWLEDLILTLLIFSMHFFLLHSF